MLHIYQFQYPISNSLGVHIELFHFSKQAGSNCIEHFGSDRVVSFCNLFTVGIIARLNARIHFCRIYAWLDRDVLNIKLP
ncbi:hypothetical protein D9M72_492580 [compost metagenome]